MAKKSTPQTAVKQTSGSKGTTRPRATNDPVFAQPSPTPDPTNFRDPVTDQPLKEVGTVEPFPAPRGGAGEPVLQFADTLGSQGAARVAAIQKAGQIVFHTVGDTGSTKGPTTQSQVADKMVADFTEDNSADVPSFFYHLGMWSITSARPRITTISSTSPTATPRADSWYCWQPRWRDVSKGGGSYAGCISAELLLRDAGAYG